MFLPFLHFAFENLRSSNMLLLELGTFMIMSKNHAFGLGRVGRKLEIF